MEDEGRVFIRACALGLIALIALGFVLNALGLLWSRPASKYAEETRKQTYDTSRQYQQGTQLDLGRYCRQYFAANGPAKTAVADLIRDTAATYQGSLTAANQACLNQIGE